MIVSVAEGEFRSGKVPFAMFIDEGALAAPFPCGGATFMLIVSAGCGNGERPAMPWFPWFSVPAVEFQFTEPFDGLVGKAERTLITMVGSFGKGDAPAISRSWMCLFSFADAYIYGQSTWSWNTASLRTPTK